MEHILDEIKATFDCGIWYPVVSSVLMLPDACGAVEFWGQNKRPRDRYIEWYDRWVSPHFNSGDDSFAGSVVYIVRNAMMHESTGFTRGEHGFDRVLFMPPNRLHANVSFVLMSNVGTDTVFTVMILDMMKAVDLGVRNWLAAVRNDPDKRRETALDKLIQYRPNGLDPFLRGFPVIS